MAATAAFGRQGHAAGLRLRSASRWGFAPPLTPFGAGGGGLAMDLMPSVPGAGPGHQVRTNPERYETGDERRAPIVGHGAPRSRRHLPMTPAERSMRARIAAYSLHAQRDARETTAPARAAFLARFEDLVDPDRILTDAERVRRAESARKAHFTRLALRSAQARRARAAKPRDS